MARVSSSCSFLVSVVIVLPFRLVPEAPRPACFNYNVIRQAVNSLGLDFSEFCYNNKGMKTTTKKRGRGRPPKGENAVTSVFSVPVTASELALLRQTGAIQWARETLVRKAKRA